MEDRDIQTHTTKAKWQCHGKNNEKKTKWHLTGYKTQHENILLSNPNPIKNRGSHVHQRELKCMHILLHLNTSLRLVSHVRTRLLFFKQILTSKVHIVSIYADSISIISIISIPVLAPVNSSVVSWEIVYYQVTFSACVIPTDINMWVFQSWIK